jgi:6-phosphofructokinase 1
VTDILKKQQFDGLCAIGGDGTFRGLIELMKYWSGQIIGIPATIDNDINGTDFTIVYYTAFNTAIQALDKIRDTAESHERVFLVEVMGREAGFIALEVGIGCGAEEILIPEDVPIDVAAVATRIRKAKERGKKSLIIIVAEKAGNRDIFSFSKELEKYLQYKTYISILGHIQRGGSPSARDRWLGTKLGSYAIDCILTGETGIMVGELNNKLVKIPLKETLEKKPIDRYAYSLIRDLAI